MARIGIKSIPVDSRECAITKPCVYRVSGACDEPQINKGNSDAACHRMNNKDVLAALSLPRNSACPR